MTDLRTATATCPTRQRTPTLGQAGLLTGAALFVRVFAASVLAPRAIASPIEEELWTAGQTGVAAGQTIIPRGVAANPLNGHIYVADQQNHRVDEFNPVGEFVKAWGWGVRDGRVEPQTCTPGSGCRRGIPGGRAGQLDIPEGVALDSSGNLYETDFSSRRVQKFSPSGQSLLAFGDDVVLTGPDNTGANEVQEVDVPTAVTGGSFTLRLTSATGYGTWEEGSDEIHAGTSTGAFQVGDVLSAFTGIPFGTRITAVSGGTLTLSQTTTNSTREAQNLTASETTSPIAWDAPASGPGSIAEALEELPAIGSGAVSVTGGPGASGAPIFVTFDGGIVAHNDVSQLSADSSSLTGGEATVATTGQGGGPELPDLVVALHGLVDIDLAARIDSVKGGIRTSFAAVPDAPVSRFILDMQGARKGLIVNSTGLCKKPKANRARAGLRAQNGKRRTLTPVVRAVKCGRRKAHRRHHKRGRRQ